MKSELKIVLEDVKEKFDTVIEGYNLLNEKLTDTLRKTRRNSSKFGMIIFS